MVALSRRKFEDVMELVKTYMFDDVFQSDFIYFCDADVAGYVATKVAESIIRGGKLSGERWEKNIITEIKHKFLNLLHAADTYKYDIHSALESNAEDIMRRAVSSLIVLKNMGTLEFSIFTTKTKPGGFESEPIIDFIEDNEDIRLEPGESWEVSVEKIYTSDQEMICIPGKRTYRRN